MKYINRFPCFISVTYFAVDGSWNSWSQFSDCDSKGVKSRSRLCTAPSPFNKGKTCQGDGEDNESCPGKYE